MSLKINGPATPENLKELWDKLELSGVLSELQKRIAPKKGKVEGPVPRVIANVLGMRADITCKGMDTLYLWLFKDGIMLCSGEHHLGVIDFEPSTTQEEIVKWIDEEISEP